MLGAFGIETMDLIKDLNKTILFQIDNTLQVYFDQFYFLVTTLTVVGYGVNMPDYNLYLSDTVSLMFMILFGTIIFSKFTGGI